MGIEIPRCIAVTGGAGFIGSAVVRSLVQDSDASVVNIDKLTYSASVEAVASVSGDPRYHFEHLDITASGEMRRVLRDYRPGAIIHLAAETHVDRSIDDASAFVHTNVEGTFTLLDEVRAYWRTLDREDRDAFRLVHVSTDEVFGSLDARGVFTPDSPYRPNSPYAATKAAADHLVRAWHHTFGLPAIITNCSNNYGPFQFPDKLIPLMIINALAGKPLPVYGRGENVRDWLHVEDHAHALRLALTRGQPGATYLIGGGAERRNIDVVREVCRCVDDLAPDASLGSRESLIRFVEDRPGHDHRYAIDASLARRELGWAPTRSFEDGLRETVLWFVQNRAWWERILASSYGLERLGLRTAP